MAQCSNTTDETGQAFTTDIRKRKRCNALRSSFPAKDDKEQVAKHFLSHDLSTTPPRGKSPIFLKSPFHTPSPNQFSFTSEHSCRHSLTPPKPCGGVRMQHKFRGTFSNPCASTSPSRTTDGDISPSKPKRFCAEFNETVVGGCATAISDKLTVNGQLIGKDSVKSLISVSVCTPPRSEFALRHLLKTPDAPRRRRRREFDLSARLPQFPSLQGQGTSELIFPPRPEAPECDSDSDFDPNEVGSATFPDFQIQFLENVQSPTTSSLLAPIHGEEDESQTAQITVSPQIIPLGLVCKRILPLLLAARSFSLVGVKQLLVRNANPNGVNELNQNALHVMCLQPIEGSENQDETQEVGATIAETLLVAGTNALHRDHAGFIPLFYAVSLGHALVANVLRRHKRKMIKSNFENYVTSPGSATIVAATNDAKEFVECWATPQRERMRGKALVQSPHKFVSKFID